MALMRDSDGGSNAGALRTRGTTLIARTPTAVPAPLTGAPPVTVGPQGHPLGTELESHWHAPALPVFSIPNERVAPLDAAPPPELRTIPTAAAARSAQAVAADDIVASGAVGAQLDAIIPQGLPPASAAAPCVCPHVKSRTRRASPRIRVRVRHPRGDFPWAACAHCAGALLSMFKKHRRTQSRRR